MMGASGFSANFPFNKNYSMSELKSSNLLERPKAVMDDPPSLIRIHLSTIGLSIFKNVSTRAVQLMFNRDSFITPLNNEIRLSLIKKYCLISLLIFS